jgi:serine O-acetyltransferase
VLKLADFTPDELAEYTARQVDALIPDGKDAVRHLVRAYLPETLDRLSKCINAVRMWTPDVFDYLHSSQYCIYLYFLSNTIWRNSGDRPACTRLFLLNKALNGIDCFYEIEMPEIFFIGHSVGIVLAKATYANYLVLYQNSTVGKNHGIAPVLGEGVVMYPNTAVIGRCKVGARTILAQGTSVVNVDCPGNSIVFNAEGSRIATRAIKRDVWQDIFR